MTQIERAKFIKELTKLLKVHELPNQIRKSIEEKIATEITML